MIISFDISEIEYILIGISIFLSIVYICWLSCSASALKKCVSECGNKSVDKDKLPPVSVVIYALQDFAYLEKHLPIWLNQDYPKYEVIIVNDGLSVEDSNIVNEFSQQYPNLYQTFLPQDMRNVSRKKLAIMVGIKAAKYDIILNTNATCCPKSSKWIESIARNFDDNTDVVICQSSYDYDSDRNFGRCYRLFDVLRMRMLYLTYAIKGKPYRGIGDNLAYRKQTFFNNKGFSHSMNLHHGDDDIFVNEIANGSNTRVELSPESIVTASYFNVAKVLKNMKLHREFTSRYIKSTAFMSAWLMSVFYYFNFLSIAALVWLNPTNIVVLAIALLLLLLLTLTQIFIFRYNSKLLNEPRLFFSIPLFTLLRPIIDVHCHIDGNRYRTQNFTWQRKKT